MPVHVNTLPDLCLCEIFSRVPVRDLLRVGRVCTKWHWLRRSIGLKVHKLTIMIGGKVEYHNFTPLPVLQAVGYLNSDGSLMYPRPKYPTWDTLYFKYLDLSALIGLTVIFPNVSTLQIGFDMISMDQLGGVTNLLRVWHTNLTTFRLYIPHNNAHIGRIRLIPSQIAESLIDALNSLSALKHLSIQLDNTRIGVVQLDLPILAQLDRFDFHTLDQTDVLLNSFGTYAITNSTLRLKYDLCMSWDDEHLARYYQLGHRFCAQFECLLASGEFIVHASAQLEHFCEHFCTITSLVVTIVDLTQFPIQNVFAILSQLTQLVHLSLGIDFVQEDDEGPVALARLPSLKSFELLAKTYSHDNLALLNISWPMPNLQMIHVAIDFRIDDFRCDLCDIHVEDNDDADDELVTVEQLKSCLSFVMLPLRHCTRLHNISFRGGLKGTSLNNLTLDDLSRPLIFA